MGAQRELNPAFPLILAVGIFFWISVAAGVVSLREHSRQARQLHKMCSEAPVQGMTTDECVEYFWLALKKP